MAHFIDYLLWVPHMLEDDLVKIVIGRDVGGYGT